MTTYTLEDYLGHVLTNVQAHLDKGWRVGQTYFNLLLEFNPVLAERVRATDVDPFYNDKLIVDFLGFVADNWNES